MTAISTPALSHLRALEAEAIHVIREVAAERERPALLFSGGKDSIVLVRLAQKAFAPGKIPFPLLHIDTGHNFPEVIEFRDRLVARTRPRRCSSAPCRSRSTRAACARRPARGPRRNRLQTVTLLDAIAAARARRLLRRRPPRRGARPRQGARAVLPRRLRPVGPAPPAPGAVGPLQRARAPRREHPRVPDLQLDRARRVAVHRLRGARAAVRSTWRTSARSSRATGCSTRSASSSS